MGPPQTRKHQGVMHWCVFVAARKTGSATLAYQSTHFHIAELPRNLNGTAAQTVQTRTVVVVLISRIHKQKFQ